MFGHRYFAPRYFAARYFDEGASSPPAPVAPPLPPPPLPPLGATVFPHDDYEDGRWILDGSGREELRKRALDDLRREVGLLPPILTAAELAAIEVQAMSQADRRQRIVAAFERKFEAGALGHKFVTDAGADPDDDEAEALAIALSLMN